MKINMNVMATVELTEFGLSHLQSQYNVHLMPKLDGMIYKTMLWGLMIDFGDCLHMGMPEIPFKDNVIEIEDL